MGVAPRYTLLTLLTLLLLLTLRAPGLLLADGAPTLGWGKTFWRFGRLFLSDPLCAIPDQKKQCERGA